MVLIEKCHCLRLVLNIVTEKMALMAFLHLVASQSLSGLHWLKYSARVVYVWWGTLEFTCQLPAASS